MEESIISLKQKIIVAVLLIVTIAAGIYLLVNYELINIIDPAINDEEIDITHIVPHSLEKYKIIDIQYTDNKIYAIIALDNGNIRIIEINDVYIDPNLKNINEGFLYRDSMQIYIKAE